MGRFQQLRAKAISLRGAIAIGGALVLAASIAQASGTLAQSTELREAKAGIATQNYYPTPLPTSISCSVTWSGLNRGANVTWESLGPDFKYRVLILRDNDPSQVREDFFTTSTSYRYRGSGATNSDRVRIYSVNTASASTDAARAQSSGYVSHTVYIESGVATLCSGGPRYDAPNADWENQYDWDPDVIPFSAPSPSFFGALFDEDADLLGDLPEGDELTSLDDAALDASPERAEQATTPPRSTPTSPTPSNPTSSRSTSAPTSPVATSAGEDATEPTLSAPVATSSPTAPATSAAATSSSVKSTPSSSTPAAPSTTAQQSVRAGVGDGPIGVGASKARLDEVDGRTRLTVTRGGSEVCTAEVDGASRIESSGGVLAVTVSGRTSQVDLGTCELT